jgi:hypothetical protein
MSKPAGIPQDVWDAARRVVNAQGRSADHFGLVRPVADALSAERERCAGVAQAYSDQAYQDGAKLSIEANSLTDTVGAALTNALGDFSKDIAEAIRQGGAS